MRDRTFEGQRYRASGLNLVVAAIVLWNTVYLEKAVRSLKQHGQPVDDSLLQHLSPLGWEPPNPTPVRVDAPADLGPAGADGLTCSERHGAGLTKKEHRQGEVSEKCPRTRSLPGRATAR